MCMQSGKLKKTSCYCIYNIMLSTHLLLFRALYTHMQYFFLNISFQLFSDSNDIFSKSIHTGKYGRCVATPTRGFGVHVDPPIKDFTDVQHEDRARARSDDNNNFIVPVVAKVHCGSTRNFIRRCRSTPQRA